MKVLNIKLTAIEQVKKFVNTVSAYDGEVDLKSGRYIVDGKSIMGIFSLDLMSPIEMTVHSDNCDELLEKLKDFIIE